MKLFKSGPSKELVLAFEQVGGGVHKRTDENRELMELLQDKVPHFLAKYPWAIGWLQNHDEFFTALAETPEMKGLQPRFSSRPNFPRPWPNLRIAGEANSSWFEHAYPLQQITIKLQGTRHSEKTDIIAQLEAVLARLKAGDTSGHSHDDDFGYTFEYVPASPGPSFFDESASVK